MYKYKDKSIDIDDGIHYNMIKASKGNDILHILNLENLTHNG